MALLESLALGRLLATLLGPLLAENRKARREFCLSIEEVLTELSDERVDVRMREYLLARHDHVLAKVREVRSYLRSREVKKINRAAEDWTSLRDEVAPINQGPLEAIAEVIEVVDEEVGPGARPVNPAQRIEDRERRLRYNARLSLRSMIEATGMKPQDR